MKRELDSAAEESGQVAYTYPGLELLSLPQGMPEGEAVEKELKQNAKNVVINCRKLYWSNQPS